MEGWMLFKLIPIVSRIHKTIGINFQLLLISYFQMLLWLPMIQMLQMLLMLSLLFSRCFRDLFSGFLDVVFKLFLDLVFRGVVLFNRSLSVCSLKDVFWQMSSWCPFSGAFMLFFGCVLCVSFSPLCVPQVNLSPHYSHCNLTPLPL